MQDSLLLLVFFLGISRGLLIHIGTQDRNEELIPALRGTIKALGRENEGL